MIDGLRPYPEMKPSGVEWLSTLPAFWQIRRAKYSFREADDRSEAGDEELLSVSHKTGVTPRSQKNITMFMAESYEGHKVCRPGDIVVNTMWAWMAAIGVSRHFGIVSPAYGIYRPRTADRFEPRYLDYILRTESYRAEFLRSSRGVTTSRLRLYPPDFLNIPVVQPPLDEQRLIVRFLDWHGALTAKLVRAKKKIIALLNEQKQAIIHRAVTRGLDPDVKLKPSRIPWLGDVPKGWELRRLGRLLDLTAGFAFNSSGFTDKQDDIRLLRGINVAPGKIRWQSVVHWPAEEAEAFSGFALRVGDIVVGMDRLIIQTGIRVARVSHEDVPSLLLQRVARVRFRSEVDVHFGFLVLGGKGFIDYLTPIFSGISVPHVSPQQISGFRFALPPIDEQRKIVEAIDVRTGGITSTLNRIEREIALIQEFRTRLIADVVTGKLDVRAVAAGLPQIGEAEPVDDLAEGDDLDEALDETEDSEVAA
jgi:type I restriction enzyme S subunit